MFYFRFKELIKTISCMHSLHKLQKKSNLNQIIKCIRKLQKISNLNQNINCIHRINHKGYPNFFFYK
jgi:hypothetical protein